MTAFSDFLENELLDHVLRNAAYTAPTSVFISLHTAATTDAGGGTEVSGNGYAREEVGGGSGQSFKIAGTPAVGATENTEAWVYPTASGAAWGLIINTAIFDAVTAGNMLFHGALTASKQVDDGDTFQFNADTYDVSLD